jgi:uncharacterized protein (UPF0264 family)
VSVRDAAEAEDAVAAGAHLIDVKDPNAGSLGCAPLDVIEDVICTVAGRRPVSAAFGELVRFTESMCGTGQPTSSGSSPRAVLDGSTRLNGLQFAKLGLADCVNRSTWTNDWQHAAARLPKGAALVAVIYADWQRAEAPPPAEVVSAGCRLGCRAMLIDTFDKQGPGLLALWSVAEIRNTIAAGRDADMITLIGGQIAQRDLSVLLPVSSDYIAVRGAVCSSSRTSRLDPDRVREFVRAL